MTLVITGYRCVVSDIDKGTTTRDTAAAMHATAEQLEEAEARLHRSAEASPVPQTRRRLHRLGDAVTAKAREIDRRADAIDDDGIPGPPRGP